MYDKMEMNAERNGRERALAVAIDKDKSSQYALKWALENIVSKHETLKLVHVKQRSTTPSSTVSKDEWLVDVQNDSTMRELFLPFRCFCQRKLVQYETCVLEDSDVSKALIEYIYRQRIGTLFLGCTARNGLSRLFRGTDITSNILKFAPDFCTVYVISSKGKIHTVRSACRQLPSLSLVASNYPHSTSNSEERYDEIFTVDTENSVACSGRLSTESDFQCFYENLGSKPARDSPTAAEPTLFHSEYSNHSNLDTPTPSSINIMDGYEDEVERLKNELQKTLKLYHEACKEAKQKAAEVEELKRKEEKRLEVAKAVGDRKSAAAETVDGEKTNVRIGSTDVIQKLVEIEIQNRLKLEMKALRTEEALDALGYQSLFHMIAVLFLFYFYFSIFK